MRRVLLFVALLALSTTGCGPGVAKVKGRVLENGQPKSFAATSASITFAPEGDGDKPKGPSFTSPINTDGTFEVVVSGGELPVGKCTITIQVKVGGSGKIFHRELVSGPNDLTFDLAKPEG